MRYLLDTNVFDYIDKNPEKIEVFLNRTGDKYYYTDIQLEKEFVGISPRKYNSECDLISYPKQVDYDRCESFKLIVKKLDASIVPRYANFMKNHLKADGSAYFLPESGTQHDMVMKIKSLHPEKRKKAPFLQEYDAMIAASAVRNHCVLITRDYDLYSVVKEFYPDGVIHLDDFIKSYEKDSII